MHGLDERKRAAQSRGAVLSDGIRRGRWRRKQEQMVTARQKSLVQSNWALMRPMAVHVADLFFDRLFELDPSLEEVFPDDTQVLRGRFTRSVGTAVGAIDDLGALVPVLHDLGRRQSALGFQPGTYVTLGKALLWTFEQTLAEDFTPPVEDAWAALYADVSSAMIQGAEPRELMKPLERTQLAV
jgi:hemoglobin-like flavoprotein